MVHWSFHDHERGCTPPKFVYYPEPGLGKMLTKLNTYYFSLAVFTDPVTITKGGVHPKNLSITLSLALGKCLRSSILTIFLWPFSLILSRSRKGVYTPKIRLLPWACLWEKAYEAQYFLFFFDWFFTDPVTITRGVYTPKIRQLPWACLWENA